MARQQVDKSLMEITSTTHPVPIWIWAVLHGYRGCLQHDFSKSQCFLTVAPSKGPGLRQVFFPPSRGFFPPQGRINTLAICSMLNLEAAISTVFATFWNHFYGNCSILELETDGKSNILELEALISAGIGFFGASSNLGLVQLEVLLGLLWCVLGVG